jgi:anti-sigma B factor antagonist
MTIEVRKRGAICIFEIHGELSYGQPTAALRQSCKEAIASGERLFLFNMLDVPWLDSSGLGEVVACHKRARENQGVVKLVLAERSRSLFTITQLQKMFDIFDDSESGIASFEGSEGGYRERF